LWVTGWMCGELRPGEVGVKFAAGGVMYGDPRPREASLNLGAAWEAWGSGVKSWGDLDPLKIILK